jgi:Domain of unknown function (DUF1992)
VSLAIEKKIEEWLKTLKPETLPGKGRPLNLDEYFAWPEDWRMGLSLLKSSGAVPTEVTLLQDIYGLEKRLAATTDPEQRTSIKKQINEQRVNLSILLEKRRR